MARSYPAELTRQVATDPKRSAEVRLFNQLCVQLGDRWSVFYSVAWIGRFRADGALHDGETDFIVAHPQHGIMLIEVKGGRIAYDGSRSQWTTTDREGNTHNIDPFAQVRKCKYDLRDKMRSLPGWSHSDVRLGHAVAFPHAVISSTTVLPPDAPSDIILDANDLERLPERLEQIMGYWHAQDTGTLVNAEGESIITALIRLLAPTTTLHNPLSIQIAEENREIFRLTAEQYRLLDFLSRTRRAAISGAAGSGKTMMAVEKATRLAREGFRVLLICYNTPLAQHLVDACVAVRAEVGNDDFFVGTFHGWCARAAEKAGLPLPTINGNPAWDEYADTLMHSLDACPELAVDAILVDEGQDMAEEWWVALEASLRDRAKAIFYVFYDDNQNVNRGAPIPDSLDLSPFPLRENVRNTRAIHKLASGFYRGPIPSEPRGPSGRTVEEIEYTNNVELQRALSRLLHRLLLVEAVPPSQIVVLTPRPLEQSGVPGVMAQLGTQHQQVLCSSVDRFKGLEQSVVVVAELDDRFAALPEQQRDALSYVAISRPRNHLSLVGHPQVLAALRQRAIK